MGLPRLPDQMVSLDVTVFKYPFARFTVVPDIVNSARRAELGL